VYARLGDTLRAAAMVDIGDETTDIRRHRIDSLRHQVQDTLPGLNLDGAQAWAGLRPATPASKPIIGAAPMARNLWLNIGHGALGFTLACGSAALLASLINGQPAAIDARPFAPT
jgi:D-amino-acid dehydrogenase